jgi:hypothetical protein
MSKNLNNILIILLIVILAMFLDFFMRAVERHYGICDCVVYRNDMQKYNLYSKN